MTNENSTDTKINTHTSEEDTDVYRNSGLYDETDTITSPDNSSNDVSETGDIFGREIKQKEKEKEKERIEVEKEETGNEEKRDRNQIEVEKEQVEREQQVEREEEHLERDTREREIQTKGDKEGKADEADSGVDHTQTEEETNTHSNNHTKFYDNNNNSNNDKDNKGGNSEGEISADNTNKHGDCEGDIVVESDNHVNYNKGGVVEREEVMHSNNTNSNESNNNKGQNGDDLVVHNNNNDNKGDGECETEDLDSNSNDHREERGGGDDVVGSGGNSSSEGSNSPPQLKRATMSLPDDFLLSATLTIRTSILAGESKRRILDDGDFKVTKKYKISMAGDKKCQIKDFAPLVFSHIRSKYGITMQSYLMSWSDDRITKEKTSGRSDAFFVHSPDCKFILKTVTKSEAKRLRKMLLTYKQHLDTYPDSLLSKIYGLHRVEQHRGLPKIYFAIFNNVLDTQGPFKEIYDLKGSSVGRRASQGDPVLKDLDFGDRKRIYLPPDIKTKMLDQIKIDCQFADWYPARFRGRRSCAFCFKAPTYGSKVYAYVFRECAKSANTTYVVPGLLFFLESAKKSAEGSPKLLRRKSFTLGKPTFATAEALKALEDDDGEPETGQTIEADVSVNSVDTATEITDTSEESEESSSKGPYPLHGQVQESMPSSSSGEDYSVVEFDDTTQSMQTPNDLGNTTLYSVSSAPLLKGSLKSNSTTERQRQLLSSSPSLPMLSNMSNNREFHVPFYQQDEGGLRSVCLQDDPETKYEIYHFGIIDFLQRYTKKKQIATFAKSLKYDKEALSTVDPTFYMTRFIKMAEKAVGDE